MLATTSVCAVTGVLAMGSLVVLGPRDVGGDAPGARVGARVVSVASIVAVTTAGVGVPSV